MPEGYFYLSQVSWLITWVHERHSGQESVHQGNEIGSHTITHSDLTQVSQNSACTRDVAEQATLQNVIGVPVVNFAYLTAYNANTLAVGKQYYAARDLLTRLQY